MQEPVSPTTQEPVSPTTQEPVSPTTQEPVSPTTQEPVSPTNNAEACGDCTPAGEEQQNGQSTAADPATEAIDQGSSVEDAQPTGTGANGEGGNEQPSSGEGQTGGRGNR